MEWYAAAAVLIGMVIVLMALGVPVALTFMTANLVGTLIFVGNTSGLIQAVDNSTALITRFQLAPVPLFILMGRCSFTRAWRCACSTRWTNYSAVSPGVCVT